jgi:hypothetical protein
LSLFPIAVSLTLFGKLTKKQYIYIYIYQQSSGMWYKQSETTVISQLWVNTFGFHRFTDFRIPDKGLPTCSIFMQRITISAVQNITTALLQTINCYLVKR